MAEQIVVPLDGSRLAEKALPHAVALARATGKGLTLLQVVSIPQPLNPLAWGAPPVSAISTLREQIWQSAREYLDDVILRLGSPSSEGTAVQVEVLEGDAAEAIITYTEQHPEVEMIVMTTRGRSGLTRWVLGSVAEKVLEASPVPLTLFRPEMVSEDQAEVDASAFGRRSLPTIPTYRTILVPLDVSVLAEEALSQAIVLASATGATLLLVSVMPLPYHIELPISLRVTGDKGAYNAETGSLLPPRQSIIKAFKELYELETQALDDYLGSVARRIETSEQSGIEVHTRILDGDAAKEILRAAEEGGADLIVMSTRGRGGLARLWLGNVAMNVVRESALPVLLVREQVLRQAGQPGQL